MSRRRARRASDDSSLELLLDTICNALGGIVFVALLICLLTQQVDKGGSSSSVADSGLKKVRESRLAQAELERIDSEISQATRQQASHEKLLATLSTGEAHIGELAKLQIEARLVADDKMEAGERIQKLQSETQRLSAERAAADGELEAAKQAVEITSRVLKEQTRKQTVRLRLPIERSTSKSQVGILLYEGRMRQPFRYDENGMVLGRNFDEIEIGAPQDRLGPKNFARNSGVPITHDADCRDLIDKRLHVFGADSFYLLFIVWPDSYKEFGIIRDHVVSKGFDYQLILMEEKEAISFGSGGESTVQ